MPEKPPAKSPPKWSKKPAPKPLTSIPRPTTTSGAPKPRGTKPSGTKPSGAGTPRPPLANQHDRVRSKLLTP
ncbi:hypothetical protein KR054_001599 [Drosophila jambulina]|nr:hypothetical protein KR054_001599 [Drosophila jambulina]